MFTDKSLCDCLSHELAAFIDEWKTTDSATQLKREYKHILAYKKEWEAAPYPPIFVTVDGIIVHRGKLLMIKRKAESGRGLFALPGGFIGEKELLIDAVIREVREETGVRVKKEWLKGMRVFDNPDRSTRGRTITHAHRFDIPAEVPIKIRAASDASKAFWVDLSAASLYSERMFEDHDQIIKAMLHVS